ncbi:cytochrome P450 [Apiosordaria backusii]|uniref:Cytochrome P450 n=1 Tax=Apiosordaria backusii TaxID=314023 RepID=A0AA40DLH3_9PEZI|nr:cytochrome P450 [Apiosordaria backusii]
MADTLRVLNGVVIPTLAKGGVIKRRPIAEGFAQHHGLDTAAVKLLQDLRRKYGSGPLAVPISLRPQLLILDPKDAAKVLDETPIPFGTETKEKRSVLSHFEPGNILISDAAGRDKLRPVHEEALTTNSRVRPFAERFQKVISEELSDKESVVSRIAGHGKELDIPSQVAHYLFAFGPAGMATFRALALLGSHLEEQKKAAEEARNANNADRPYSRAILLESLRLWPTTPAILRETTRDAELGGKTVPKGTQAVIFAPFFHRDDERLEFAHKLSPERWLDTEVDVDNGLLPFSAGPGMCPAHNLVPMVASLAIEEIVRQAEVELVEPGLEKGDLRGTLDHFEIKLRLTKRA